MQTLGIFGLGAFGQLMALNLKEHFKLLTYDPSLQAKDFATQNQIAFEPIEVTASADIVILATQLERMSEVVRSIIPFLKRDALVIDVGSVKVITAQIMKKELPDYVEIIGTHPLFGPQSAKNGIAGLKIAICPIRTTRLQCITQFLQSTLKLNVIETTPEEHDREMAAAQGLTHLIAKVLAEIEPLPQKMTTASYDLIMQAVDMVRHDSMELFLAICRDNPYSADIRQQFFTKAEKLQKLLDARNTRS